MLKRFAPLTALAFILTAPALARDAAAPAAGFAPAAEAATTQIVIETAMGDIVVAVETGRAPVSAANFLRYVDEKRLDGTVFYRAMTLDWGAQPNGLIQAGTQFDPERTLPPIAHEPTSETGLCHTSGALSLARNEPGSATGDFSIMVGDQTGLDADPDSEDPELRAGYAVFGHVIEGMEVVKAIHAAPTDPDEGEGWMQGQMLADPVAILAARRVEEPG